MNSVREENIDNLNKGKKRVINARNTDIRKNYEFISMLGNGAFGKVRLYRDRHDKNFLLAIKTLKKEGIPAYQFNLLKSEVAILSNLDHPNIVKYLGTFEDDYFIHILMEYLKGHDLNKIIALKKYTGFDEKDMCKITQQLLKALSFIHGKNIVHRDIKPENILFSNRRDYTTLKLIDFGLATHSTKDHKSVGTPYFMSPEMITGDSVTKSDIWSVGVVVYLMLTGKYPFNAPEDENLFEVIRKSEYNKDCFEDLECSEEVKDFISKCLVKNVEQRMSTDECLSHPWILKYGSKNDDNILEKETYFTLVQFANKSVLQKEIYFFLARVSNESDLVTFKNLFNQLDISNVGEISKDEIGQGFSRIGVKISPEDLDHMWNGLDFHKDGRINYTEFLAAMLSSYDIEKEEKLMTVFNLFKENNKNKDYITFDSLRKAVKALNIKMDEEEMLKCFLEYGKEIKFEEFKKMILDSELKDKTEKEESIQNINGYLKFGSSKSNHKNRSQNGGSTKKSDFYYSSKH